VVAVTNLLLLIVITQVSGVSALGHFAVITATILIALGLTRLLVCDPWLASRTASRTPGTELRSLVLAASVLTIFLVGAVILISSIGDGRWYLACLVAPVVVVQDFGRYCAFRDERPAWALASDSSVLVAGALLFGVFAFLGTVGLTAVLLSWAFGLVVGAIVVAPRFAGPVALHGAVGWWRRFCRPLATKLALDGVAFLVAVNGSLYLLAYLGTPQDVGSVRIVQSVFSPAMLTITGLTMWLVPFLANRGSSQASHMRRRVTVWLGVGSVPAVTVAVLLGPWFARVVFGVADPPSTLALSLAGLSTIALAVSAPWVASARVTGHYTPIAWTRALSAAVTWAGMIFIVALRSTTGYLGLLALQSIMIGTTSIFIGVRDSRRTLSRELSDAD